MNSRVINTKSLLELFGALPSKDATQFIIYSEKVTERLKYVCDFVFCNSLNCNYTLCDDLSVFNTSQFLKINYSNSVVQNVYRIHNSGFCFEQEIRQMNPDLAMKQGMNVMFPSPECDLGFDIFAAVFYNISRYEEWLSHKRDMHGRFELKESILYRNSLHLRPIVDEWVTLLRSSLKKYYPNTKLPERQFRQMASVDVDNLFAYQNKSVGRSLGASVRDLIKTDFKSLIRRCKVLSGSAKDPFDVYGELVDFCKTEKTPLFFFFLMSTGSRYDRTVSDFSAFNSVFSLLNGSEALYGLHPGYDSSDHSQKMKEEFESFESRAGFPARISRQHYLRFDIRTTPRMLLQNGVIADFTLGYASGSGFRAGTTIPFRYFDLKNNSSSDLLMVPFCSMDGAYFIYNSIDPGKAQEELIRLKKTIKETSGNFLTVFHERTFDDHLYKGFGDVFYSVYQNT